MVVNFHNHLVRGSRQAAFAAIGLGMVTSASAEITGKNTAEFETVISVQSTSDVCKLMVTPPADNKFAVSYSYKADGTSDIEVVSPNKDPRYIMVTAVGGVSCDPTQVRMTINTNVGNTFLDSLPNTSGGIWRLRPDFSDVRVYTSTNATSSMPSDTRAGIKGSDYMRSTPRAFAGDKENTYHINENRSGMSLTDSYVSYLAYPGNMNHIIIEDKNRVYKLLALGIGGTIALVPSNAEGKPSPGLVSDGDETRIPFTVTITAP